MRRDVSVLLVVVAVLAAAAMGPLAAAAVPEVSSPVGGSAGPASTTAVTDAQTQTNGTANGTANETSPGERLSGVLGVSDAELAGEMEARTFQASIRNRSNRTTAAVIARQVNASEERLSELRTELDRLETARENGSLTEGQYRARTAAVATRIRTVERLLNESSDASRGVPDSLLRERGVNTTALARLQRNASELTGPEVAEIARGIAGRNAGRGLGSERAADDGARGPPEGERGPSDDARGQRDGERGPPNAEGDGGPNAPGENGNSGAERTASGGGANETENATANETTTEASPGNDGDARGPGDSGGSNAPGNSGSDDEGSVSEAPPRESDGDE